MLNQKLQPRGPGLIVLEGMPHTTGGDHQSHPTVSSAAIRATCLQDKPTNCAMVAHRGVTSHPLPGFKASSMRQNLSMRYLWGPRPQGKPYNYCVKRTEIK